MGTFGRPCFAKSKHRLSEKRSFSTGSDRSVLPRSFSLFLIFLPVFAADAAAVERFAAESGLVLARHAVQPVRPRLFQFFEQHIRIPSLISFLPGL